MLVGAHVSVSKGYPAALEYALSVGCECIQVFAKSPRQWNAAPLDPDAAAEFIALREAKGFGPVFTHTAYLINLSTTDPVLRERSIAALADELHRGSLLSASGVVTHIGNDPDGDAAAAAVRAADSVVRAIALANERGGSARLLLENTAGAGRSFGGSFGQIASTIAHTGLPAEQLGTCFDTCHGFAYGFELDTADGWDLVAEELIGLAGGGRLGLIHANDCKGERGSNKDRHEWIGDGMIGAVGFGSMMTNALLTDVPVVTEMPGEPPEKDSVNIGRLTAMREACAPSQ